jgi:hypothetical protein
MDADPLAMPDVDGELDAFIAQALSGSISRKTREATPPKPPRGPRGAPSRGREPKRAPREMEPAPRTEPARGADHTQALGLANEARKGLSENALAHGMGYRSRMTVYFLRQGAAINEFQRQSLVDQIGKIRDKLNLALEKLGA